MAAELLAEFARAFGVPFLRGGPCTVGDPLGRDGFLAIRHGIAIDAGLQDACELQLTQAGLFADVTPAPFDEDAATILYAVHDLYASSHPQAGSFYARAHLFCRAAELRVAALPRTLSPDRLLTRHLLVERAFLATRVDTHLKWWTGHASFYGTEPAKRLLALPNLRRVEVDRQTAPMWRIALATGNEEARLARVALLTALLDASPLTRVVLLGDLAQRQLGFQLLLPYRMRGRRVSALDALDDRRLARAATDALIARGVDAAGPMLALALLQALRESCPPLILRRAVELCAHLALTMCFIEGEQSGAPEASTLRSLLDDDIGQLNEALRVYWAVVKAALDLSAELLAVPLENDLPPSMHAVWRRLRVRLAHKRIVVVAEPLVRELARRLPTAARDDEAEAAP